MGHVGVDKTLAILKEHFYFYWPMCLIPVKKGKEDETPLFDLPFLI